VGETPAFDERQVRKLLESVDTSHVVGVRDRALLMVLAYTAARAGAVARLRTQDHATDGRSWSFELGEKGGKRHRVPCRHDFRVEMEHSPAGGRAGGWSDKTPLFRAVKRRKRELTGRGLSGNDLLRVVERRLRDAGLPPDASCCQSLRATTATNLLKQRVPREPVQQLLLGQADARTTALYDRTEKEVARNIVERISI
jgi:integrase